jgi:hypothetical protein
MNTETVVTSLQLLQRRHFSVATVADTFDAVWFEGVISGNCRARPLALNLSALRLELTSQCTHSPSNLRGFFPFFTCSREQP